MNSTLSFEGNREGIREFAQFIAELQTAGVHFSIDRSGSRYLVTILSGEAC